MNNTKKMAIVLAFVVVGFAVVLLRANSEIEAVKKQNLQLAQSIKDQANELCQCPKATTPPVTT